MDLFDHKLTTNEAIHLDSLLDTGSYDPYLLLVGSMLKDNQYLPSQQTSAKIMQHIGDINEPNNNNKVEPQREPKIIDVPNVEEEDAKNKNPRIQYIKLPDATIERRKHKSKQNKTKRDNESKTK